MLASFLKLWQLLKLLKVFGNLHFIQIVTVVHIKVKKCILEGMLNWVY